MQASSEGRTKTSNKIVITTTHLAHPWLNREKYSQLELIMKNASRMITVRKLYFTGNTHRLIVHAKDQLNTAQQSNRVFQYNPG